MSATLFMSVLLAAQPLAMAPMPLVESESEARVDASYDAIAAGRSSEAIMALEQRLSITPDDPAMLINLAAAYLQIGDLAKAATAYRAAIASDTRYEMELADGTWIDSRSAARQGLKAIESRAVAIR